MLDFIQRFIGKTKSSESRKSLGRPTPQGAIVVRDSRGRRRAEIPNVSIKSETLGNDPLAMYKPTGAEHVDAPNAMGNFTGWTFAAVMTRTAR
jgi:hypothetical protein